MYALFAEKIQGFGSKTVLFRGDFTFRQEN